MAESSPAPMDGIPAYDDLPLHDITGMPHSWGILDPNLGSLSHTRAAAIRGAAGRVATGETVSLSISLGLINPPLFGRSAFTHSVHALDRNTFEDELSGWNPQSGSQWDGFRHVRAREAGFYGGITEFTGAHADALSIEHVATRGVVSRGVLLDVVRWLEAQGRTWDPLSGDMVEAADLARIAADQGVELQPGDILCLRLGWVGAYRTLTVEERAHERVSQRFSGIRATEDTARFLWNARVGAVCADNPGIESSPGSREDGSLHRRLLPMLGIVMGEIFDFDTLAERCAAHSRYDFLFVSAPLPVPGGLSSPANAIAIL